MSGCWGWLEVIVEEKTKTWTFEQTRQNRGDFERKMVLGFYRTIVRGNKEERDGVKRP